MVKELLEYLVKQIVEKPENVIITVNQSSDAVACEVGVHETDRGRLIGKDGRTIKAIRALVTSVVPEGMKVTVEVASSVS
jgi:uncharacterized protein